MLTNRPLQRSLAVGLIACLLLLSALVYAQTVRHAAHHVHHQAATHASALCSWLCAAGQGLEGVTVVLQTLIGLLTLTVVLLAQKPLSPLLGFSSTRGPPFRSI
jgi:hypothetical protein